MARHSKKKQSKRRTLIITAALATLSATIIAPLQHGGNVGNASTHAVVRHSYQVSEASRGSYRENLLKESVSSGKVTGTWELGEDVNIPYSQSTDEKGAVSALKSSVDTGNKKLSDSDGKVTDAATRKALQSAVDNANNLVKADAGDNVRIDVDAYNKAGAAINDAIGKVDASMKDWYQQRAAAGNADSASSGSSLSATVPVGEMQQWFHDYLIANGYTEADFSAGVWIINHESGWNPRATNPSSGAYGLPQSLPGSKMASMGADWQTNYQTQLKWFVNYCKRYGGIQGSYNFWQTHHWY